MISGRTDLPDVLGDPNVRAMAPALANEALAGRAVRTMSQTTSEGPGMLTQPPTWDLARRLSVEIRPTVIEMSASPNGAPIGGSRAGINVTNEVSPALEVVAR